jgi:hypothetical protein
MTRASRPSRRTPVPLVLVRSRTRGCRPCWHCNRRPATELPPGFSPAADTPSRSSGRPHPQARENLRQYFANPEPNVERIVDWLRELDDDVPDTIRGITLVHRPEHLRELAGTPAGRRVLDWLRDRWRRHGDASDRQPARLTGSSPTWTALAGRRLPSSR